MKDSILKKVFTLFAGLCACLFLCFSFDTTSYAKTKGNIDTVLVEEVVTEELDEDGEAVTEERNIYVYTPSGYNEKTKYPVLYLLEGLHSVDNEALKNTKLLDTMIENEEIPPILVVIVPESVYKVHTMEEIIFLTDTLYSTKTESKDRIIAGFSNGAYRIWNKILPSATEVKLADIYIPMSPIGSRKLTTGKTAFQRLKKQSSRIKIINTCGNAGCEENYCDLYGGVEQMECIVETGSEYGFLEGKNIFCYQAEGEHTWQQVWNALQNILPVVYGKEDVEYGGLEEIRRKGIDADKVFEDL